MSSVVTVAPAVLSSVSPDCSVPTAVMAGSWLGVFVYLWCCHLAHLLARYGNHSISELLAVDE